MAIKKLMAVTMLTLTAETTLIAETMIALMPKETLLATIATKKKRTYVGGGMEEHRSVERLVASADGYKA